MTMPNLIIRIGQALGLASRLARLTGETLTEAVTEALRERLEREERRRQRTGIAAGLMEIGRRCSAVPMRDARSREEILGYDERGLPQ